MQALVTASPRTNCTGRSDQNVHSTQNVQVYLAGVQGTMWSQAAEEQGQHSELPPPRAIGDLSTFISKPSH